NKQGLKEINVITELKKRINEFQRPNVSNIDNAILVTSIVEPKLNDFYLDKLITIFHSRNIKPILIFTKKDLSKNEKYLSIINEYINAGFKVLITNKNITSHQKDKLHNWTKDKLSVITGQTGVGKSTLLNNINKYLNIEVGEISKSLGRGKHTTRHAEAFEIFNNSFIIDTPGFSSLEIKDLDSNTIAWNFFDFEKNIGMCKFRNCLHINEKGCKIIMNGYSERVINNYKKLLKNNI
ncbi:MAG: ribosome small subunit-dependent GTPase A, partial [Mycoplasmataceae bacterium]|nr:ribosome small subunit-dependent GTPase A [Mycoplasmataceae bacterium]